MGIMRKAHRSDQQPDRDPLSAQRAIAKHLVPQLTERQDDSALVDRPILVIKGPPGSGRTRALTEIDDTYRRSPCALINKQNAPRGEDGSSAPSIVQLLAAITAKLGLRRGWRRYGTHRLAAFMVCFDLLSNKNLQLPGADMKRALQSFLRKLYFVRLSRVDASIRAFDERTSRMPWPFNMIAPIFGAVARAVVFPFFWNWKWKVSRRLRACQTFPAPGDMHARLFQLRSWDANPDGRELADQAMCEVLLSDLDAFARKHRRRAVNLVLLDDVDLEDETSGTLAAMNGRLLRHIAKLHAMHSRKEGWGPLAFVATAEGPPSQSAQFAAATANHVEDDHIAGPRRTPVATLEKAMNDLRKSGSRTNSETWFMWMNIPSPNRDDVGQLGGGNYPHSGKVRYLDWIRLAGRGNIPLTESISKAVSNLSDERMAELIAIRDLYEYRSKFQDLPCDIVMPTSEEVAALGRESNGADLGEPHPFIRHGQYVPPRTRQQNVRYSTVAVIGVVLAASISIGGCEVSSWCDFTGTIVESGEHSECVGVSDGSYVFDDRFKDVFALIKKENDWVERNGDEHEYVSVAFTAPLTSFETNPNGNDAQWTLHQVEGAYLAQHRANHSTRNAPGVRIKLLLANVGAGARQWEEVADDLIERKDAEPDRLIGLAGLGSSYSTTEEFMRVMSENGIPMMAAVTTADDIVSDKPMAFRVAPDNTSEVVVESDYLHGRGDANTAMLVKDTRPDDEYARTLANAFDEHYPDDDHKIEATEPFVSGEPGVTARLKDIVSNVCSLRPDIVFFAGRGRGDLPDFIVQLAERKCSDFPVRIVTGSDASHFPDEPGPAPGDPNLPSLLKQATVTVEFPNLALPGQWADSVPAEGLSDSHRRHFSANMSKFVGAYEAKFDEKHDLLDGQAIMSFDAVTVFVDAIQASKLSELSTGSLHNAMLGFRSCGAATETLSGVIELDEDGNAVNKTMVIERISGPGTPEAVQLAWPDGKPTPIRDNC